MNEDIAIQLPSLIHRIGRDQVNKAKEIGLQYQCLLKRIRRSRNWQLSGGAVNIASYLVQLEMQNDELFHYFIQKIKVILLDNENKLEPLEMKLVRLITDNPNITLTELIYITDCTLAEARVARFQLELW